MLKRHKIKKPLLKDVAEKAGLSVAAVSQILNNRAVNFCSEEKKAKVKALAVEMNYQPNFGYQLLHGIKTNTVGIICSTKSAENEEHIQALQVKLMGKIEQENYSTYVSTMTDDEERNVNTVSNLAGRGCSAFIFIGTPVGFRNIEDLLISSSLNYIAFRAPSFRRNISMDKGWVTKEYIGYLKEKGKTDFICVGDDLSEHHTNFSRGIYESFPGEGPEQLLAKYYYPTGRNVIFTDGFAKQCHEKGFNATKTLMRERPDTQAFIYANDYLAIGGAYAILEAGLTPGKDILIRGYNNTSAVCFFPYPISSVDNGIEQICDVLLENFFTDGALDIVIKPKLIIRDFKPLEPVRPE